jgi:hypothetical protein
MTKTPCNTAIKAVMDGLMEQQDSIAHHITSGLVFDREPDEVLIKAYEEMWKMWEQLAQVHKEVQS